MASVKTISSQDYRNADIIAAKLAARDFTVTVSPTFDYDGETYRVILDGHHAFSAAIEAGEAPMFVEADATAHDAINLLANGDVETFLEATHLGADYHDAFTGFSAF